MLTLRKNQKGFSVVEGLIIVIAIGAIGGIGFRIATRDKDDSKQTDTTQSSDSEDSKTGDPTKNNWQFIGTTNEWQYAAGTPLKCPDPMLKRSPVDLSKVVGVGYPGAYRGFSYKPHGGFRFDGYQATDPAIQVYTPMDGLLTGLVRYYEMGELQYLLFFQNDCGVTFKFDHIAALTPEFQAVADTTPAPKEDTQSQPLQNPKFFKAGTKVSTAVGFPVKNNIGMDFGMTDYRQRNEISRNDQWRALHMEHPDTEWYGICWFDYLEPPDQVTRIKSLKLANASQIHKSDYCPSEGGNTLKYNGGKPTND